MRTGSPTLHHQFSQLVPQGDSARRHSPSRSTGTSPQRDRYRGPQDDQAADRLAFDEQGTSGQMHRQLERRLGGRWLAAAVATERRRHCVGGKHIFCGRLQSGNHHSDRYSARSCSSFFIAGRRLAI